MYFLIEDDDLLEKCNTNWDITSADIKKELDGELVYNKQFLETEIRSHSDEVTDFYDQKIPKVDSTHTCLAVISLDSAHKKMKTIIYKSFWKSVNMLRKKVVRHIKNNLSNFSYSDEYDEE